MYIWIVGLEQWLWKGTRDGQRYQPTDQLWSRIMDHTKHCVEKASEAKFRLRGGKALKDEYSATISGGKTEFILVCVKYHQRPYQVGRIRLVF